MQQRTLLSAMALHLRLAKNESMSQFAARVRELSAEDKEWLKTRFEIEGYCKIVDKLPEHSA